MERGLFRPVNCLLGHLWICWTAGRIFPILSLGPCLYGIIHFLLGSLGYWTSFGFLVELRYWYLFCLVFGIGFGDLPCHKLLRSLWTKFIWSVEFDFFGVHLFSWVAYIYLVQFLDPPWSLFAGHLVSIYCLCSIGFSLVLYWGICHIFSIWMILLRLVVSYRRNLVTLGLWWCIFFWLCFVVFG